MRQKRIPTILGLVLILFLLASLTLLKRGRILRSRAEEELVPREVWPTNITDSAFTVSWVTTGKTSGLVKLLGSQGEELFPDQRDKTGELGQFETHYVEVSGLQSDREYQFVIISGGKEFKDRGEKPFRVKTAKPFAGEVPQARLASGRVETGDGQPASGAIVYYIVEGISPLSSLVTSQGNWAISLAKAFNAALTGPADYREGKITAQILVQGGKEGNASALVYTQNDDPVPLITLGQHYDFTREELGKDSRRLTGATPTPSITSASRLRTPLPLNQPEKQFAILSPEDGEKINFPRPEIFGTGPRGGELEIVLESPVQYRAKVKIDSEGNWRWTPPQDLAPGSHLLTIKYTNPQTGEEETFIRSFILAASQDWEFPAFSASSSAATPTLTPTPSPSPTPTVTLALSPSPAFSPTPTAVASPTATPMATLMPSPRAVRPATDSGVPQSGFVSLTHFLFLAGSIVWLIFALI